MAKLIDGRAIAEKVYVDLRNEIAELKSKGVTPGLAVILVGENPASRAYVRSKDKMCRDLGLHSLKLELPESTTQRELLRRVEELNRDSSIHGILVQSPPPEHIDEVAIVRARPAERRGRISSRKCCEARARRFQRLCPVHAAWRATFAYGK